MTAHQSFAIEPSIPTSMISQDKYCIDMLMYFDLFHCLGRLEGQIKVCACACVYLFQCAGEKVDEGQPEDNSQHPALPHQPP